MAPRSTQRPNAVLDRADNAYLVMPYGRIVAATNPGHAAHEYFSSLYRQLRTELTEAIAASQSAGALPSGWSPETFATVMLALKDGLALQSLLSPDAVDPVAVMREVNAALRGAPPAAQPTEGEP